MSCQDPQHSSITVAVAMNPEDTNPAGNVHGGVIMKHIDTAGGVVAHRHARKNTVTACIDHVAFHHPVYVGDLLILKAGLNYAGKTSMEVGVRVEAENLLTGEIRHTASAYLTYVALDELGRPTEIPPYVPRTEEEQRRCCEAQVRRDFRLAQREQAKSCGKAKN
jgi:acyl-CoA hydrolase